MKIYIKSLFTLALITTSVLSATQAASAAAPSPSDPVQGLANQLQAINTNIQVVGNQMQSLSEANVKAQYPSLPDPSIAASAALNPLLLNTIGTNNQNLMTSNVTDITSQLQPVSLNLLETGNNMPNATEISQQIITQANLKTSLSTQLPASDTIYSNDPEVLALSSQNMAELPSWGLAQLPATQLHDNYFSFSTLFQPLAYTDNGTAASTFLTFITQGYNNPSTPINYSAFQQKLAQAGSSGSAKLSLYLQLLQDQNYINYQLSARSATSMRSVAVSNFQNLITERTPVTGLGTSAGMVDSQGNPIPNASPLQVESYLATRRVNNPGWYKQIQTESPASVQRETLVVLAEIEAQNFQAHLDSERLLAAISAQVASSSSNIAQLNNVQANQVNADIQGFTLTSPTSATTNIATPSNNSGSSGS